MIIEGKGTDSGIFSLKKDWTDKETGTLFSVKDEFTGVITPDGMLIDNKKICKFRVVIPFEAINEQYLKPAPKKSDK